MSKIIIQLTSHALTLNNLQVFETRDHLVLDTDNEIDKVNIYHYYQRKYLILLTGIWPSCGIQHPPW